MKDFFPSIYLYLCLYLFCKYNQSIHTYVWFQSLSVKIKMWLRSKAIVKE